MNYRELTKEIMARFKNFIGSTGADGEITFTFKIDGKNKNIKVEITKETNIDDVLDELERKLKEI